MSPSAIMDGGSPTHAIGAHPQTEGPSTRKPCLQEGGMHRDIKGQAWMPYQYKPDGWGKICLNKRIEFTWRQNSEMTAGPMTVRLHVCPGS